MNQDQCEVKCLSGNNDGRTEAGALSAINGGYYLRGEKHSLGYTKNVCLINMESRTDYIYSKWGHMWLDSEFAKLINSALISQCD